MPIGSAAKDVSSPTLFSGLLGNYLKPSLAAAGLDPDNLPDADKNKMDFSAGRAARPKAWSEIWGSGQGVGSIDDIPSVAACVDRLETEYRAALETLGNAAGAYGGPITAAE